MEYVFEDTREGDTCGETRTFKTQRGATSYGCKLFRTSGYFAANRFEGERYRKHVVAEWKDRGEVIGKVWT